MADHLAPQRPSDRAGRRGGRQQLTEPVLPLVRRGLADTLRELSAAVRAYGSLATELDPRRHDALKAELERHLAAARDQQEIGRASCRERV